MGTTLDDLRQELHLVVKETTFQEYYQTWLNDAVEEIALTIDLPALKLLTPALLTVTTTDWLYDVPNTVGGIATVAITAAGTGYTEGDILTIIETGAQGGRVVLTEVAGGVPSVVTLIDAGTGYSVATGKVTTGGTGTGCTISVATLLSNQVAYHKKLFQAVDSDYNYLRIPSHNNSFRFENLDRLDIDHDETSTHVTHLAISEDATKVGIYPKASEILRLWFFKQPTPMTDGSDEPSCIPEAFRKPLLVSKVVLKNFKMLQDLMVSPPHQSLTWWQNEYAMADMNLINHLAMQKRPMRRGGRDPVGWRWNT